MKKILKKFCKDKSGNFAMMFALSLLPVMMTIGMAMDYTRASSEKGNVQDAMDLATLASVRNINTMTDAELKQSVKDFMKANLSEAEYGHLYNIVVDVNRAEGKMNVTADSYTPTTVSAVAGKDKFHHKIATEVKVGLGDIEIAMVLDNTHSMSADGKIAALKTSAKDFVESLFDIDNGAGNLSISLVPFNQYVNVGMANRNASWIDVPDDYTEEEAEQILVPDSCVPITKTWDGVEYESTQCDYTDGPMITKNYIWNGCVGSREEPLNIQDGSYVDEVPGVLFKDIYADDNCPDELVPLSKNKADLLTKLDEMDPDGRTYIPSGIMWGWRALSSQAPYNQGASMGLGEVQKIMVLMTDGDNQASADFSSGYHWNDDIEEANTMTTSACNSAKAAGITIYTITFGADIAADTKTLMQNCATTINNYFDAADSDDLDDSFLSIMKKIGKVRISS